MKRTSITGLALFLAALSLLSGCTGEPKYVQIALEEPTPAAAQPLLEDLHNARVVDTTPAPIAEPSAPSNSTAPCLKEEASPATPAPTPSLQPSPTLSILPVPSPVATPTPARWAATTALASSPSSSPTLTPIPTPIPTPSPIPTPTSSPSPSPFVPDPSQLTQEQYDRMVQDLKDQLNFKLQAYQDSLESLQNSLLSNPSLAPLIQNDIDDIRSSMNQLILDTQADIDRLLSLIP